MLGLTFEKLFVVAVVAALVIGPKRLPVYTRQLTDLIRSMRSLVDVARTRAESDMGFPLDREQWIALDPRQYDPRRIVRDALREPAVADAAPSSVDVSSPAGEAGVDATTAPRVRTYRVTGTSGHPRRVVIDEANEPSDLSGVRER